MAKYYFNIAKVGVEGSNPFARSSFSSSMARCGQAAPRGTEPSSHCLRYAASRFAGGSNPFAAPVLLQR